MSDQPTREADIAAAKAWLCQRWCQDHPNAQHVIQLADYAVHLRTLSPTLDEAAMGNRKNMSAPDSKRSGALVSDIQSEAVSVSVSALDEAAIVERCACVADAVASRPVQAPEQGVWERAERATGKKIAAAIRREGVTAVGELARVTQETKPFGFYVEQRLADPAFLRRPAWIPEPSERCKVTPLYATPTPNAAADALAWFSTQHMLELSHKHPVYGDDDDQDEEWQVHRQSGSINDREWDLVGRGATATEAIIAALAQYRQQQIGGAK